MTVKDIYEQTIKPLTDADRAELAELILDDLGPEPPMPVRNRAHLEELLAEGFDSESTLANDKFWAERERRLDERRGPA